jgi:hypothetical protein
VRALLVKTHRLWPTNLSVFQLQLNSGKLEVGYSPLKIVYGREVDGQLQPVEEPKGENRGAQDVREMRERRSPTRTPPVDSGRFQVGQFVVRVYDKLREEVISLLDKYENKGFLNVKNNGVKTRRTARVNFSC